MRRARGRTALIVVMVMLPVVAGSFLAVILAGGEPTWQNTLDTHLGSSAAAQIQAVGFEPVTQTPQGDFAGSEFVDEGSLATAPAADLVTRTQYEQHILTALPTGTTLHPEVAVAQLATSEHGSLTLVGVQVDLTDRVLADKYKFAQGVAPTGPKQIALSPAIAENLGVSLGDTITLTNTDEQHVRGGGRSDDVGAASYPTVTGILAPVNGTRGTFVADAVLPLDSLLSVDELFERWHTVAQDGHIMPMTFAAEAPTWLVAGGSVDPAQVQVLNSAGIMAISRDVDPSMVTPQAQHTYEWKEQNKRAENAWLALVMLIGLLQATLMAGPAFAVGAKRSERDLKIMATQGADRAALTTATLGHGVILGAIGSLLGVVLGFAAVGVMWWFQPRLIVSLQPPVWQLIAIVAAGVLISTVAAWLPARSAAKHYSTALDEPFSRDRYSIGKLPWIGLALIAASAVGAVVAAGMSSRELLLVCVVGLEVALILATGLLLQFFATASKRMPLTWRYAARDAVRHRSRTIPATAAIIASIAGLTGALVYNASDAQFRADNFVPSLASQTLAISAYDEGDPLTETDIEAIMEAVREVAPNASDPVPVAVVVPDDVTIQEWWPVPPDQENTETVSYSAMQSYPNWDWPLNGVVATGAIVNDGTVADLLALPNPEQIRAALATGRVAVPTAMVHADSTAEFNIWQRPRIAADDTVDEGTDDLVVVPAARIDGRWPTTTTAIIPPALAAERGWQTQTRSVLVDLNRPMLSDSQLNLLATDMPLTPSEGGTARTGAVIVTGGAEPNEDNAVTFTWMVVAIAMLLTLAATGIVTVLAVAESRGDMATMAAVGATPRTRKMIAAMQATFTAISGILLGLVGGGVLGLVLVQMERSRGTDWTMVIPWLPIGVIALVVPIIAAAVAAALTRSRLPATQRTE